MLCVYGCNNLKQFQKESNYKQKKVKEKNPSAAEIMFVLAYAIFSNRGKW
jgi:hypothetical protein